MAHDILYKREIIDHVTYITKIGFRGYDQIPFVMIYKEEWYQDQVEWASVLFQIRCPFWLHDLLVKIGA